MNTLKKYFLSSRAHTYYYYYYNMQEWNQYRKPMDSNTLHTESEVYDINYREKQA